MAKKEKKETPQEDVLTEETVEAPETPETPAEPNPWEAKYNEAQDSYLRLRADYENFRKRTVKEKETSYSNGMADTVLKLLPVYDNLERALNQPTEDAAYKKGVELTMAELVKILSAMNITAFGETGDGFDPNMHNAVMHTEDDALGENTISMVFQKGFRMGERVIRFAMVQVAN